MPRARTSLWRKGGVDQVGLGGWEPRRQGHTHPLELPASSVCLHLAPCPLPCPLPHRTTTYWAFIRSTMPREE